MAERRRLPADRVGEGTEVKAFNNPTVDCCDRDAADCDCSFERQVAQVLAAQGWSRESVAVLAMDFLAQESTEVQAAFVTHLRRAQSVEADGPVEGEEGDTPTDHGFVCKQCDTPSPFGIGYLADGADAARASAEVSACECGYSRRPTPREGIR